MRPAPIAVFSFGGDTDDLLDGLRAPRKRLPSRLLRDARGVELFAQLARAEDFYPARTERELVGEHAAQIATQVGPEARIVEIAGGEPTTSRRLVHALDRPTSVTPIASTPEELEPLVHAIRADLPALEVLPVVGDPTRELDLPVPQREWRRTLVYIPGCTLGTLEPSDARACLERMARLAGDERLLLLGADSTRDPAIATRAYDDDSGIAEAFAKNALAHLNRTRAATFDLDAFEYRTTWSTEAARLELQLVSRTRQIVRVDGELVTFAPGEAISVERAYKHAPEAMRALLASAGWLPRQVFTSSQHPYRLWLCEPMARFGTRAIWPQLPSLSPKPR